MVIGGARRRSALEVIELIDVEDGIVKVRLVGACAHCPSSALTLYEGVEKMLMDLVPEVKGIEQVW